MTCIRGHEREAVLTLTVPMPPNLANRQMHHMVRHRFKLGYWAALDWVILGRYDDRALRAFVRDAERCRMPDLKRQLEAVRGALNWPPQRLTPPASPWQAATIASTMYLGAPMDDGNAMNRHKWAEDWLVERGFLVDDKRAVLRWAGLPEQIVRRGQEYRIVLTLRAMSETDVAA